MLKPVRNPGIESIAEIMKVMGETNRLHILQLLSKQGLCVCELTALCHMSQSNVSQHLFRLKSTDLVKERRNAQWIYYSLNEDNFPVIHDILNLLPLDPLDLSSLETLKGRSSC